MAREQSGGDRQSLRVALDPDLTRQVRIVAACEGVSVHELVQRLLRPVVEGMARERLVEMVGVEVR